MADKMIDPKDPTESLISVNPIQWTAEQWDWFNEAMDVMLGLYNASDTELPKRTFGYAAEWFMRTFYKMGE
jgi:hypothetical protein